MKQLLMAMAIGVGMACFAAQNDTVISFSTGGDTTNPDKYQDGTPVKDGENYALVWTVAGQNFEGFNNDGTLVNPKNSEILKIASAAKDGRCPGVSFQIPADLMEKKYNGGKFELFLLDTRAGGSGDPAVASGTSVFPVNAWGQVIDPQIGVVTDQIAQDVGTEGTITVRGGCVYADNRILLKGERFVLVGYKEGEAVFGGLTCDCRAIGNGVKVEACFAAGENGECEINLDELNLDQTHVYELIAVDSRTSDGTLSKTWDLDGIVRPQFISAWGRVISGDTFDSIKWNAIKLGDNVFLKQFDFDPTPYLADGFAAVCDEGGAQVKRLGSFAKDYGLQAKTSWMVFGLPKAYVRSVENKELTRDVNYSHLRDAEVPVPFTLDATYQFDAFLSDEERDIVSNALENTTITHADFNLEQTLAKIGDAAKRQIFLNWYMRAVPFFGWNCDFEVRFDAAVSNDTFVLAGFYDYLSAWRQYNAAFAGIVGTMGEPWIGSSSDHVLKKGEPFRLLQSYVGAKGNITVNYEEICTKVKTFLCGVYNDSPDNWGKTITVDLNMYPNVGRETEEQLGDGTPRKYTVGTYRYTFRGPLNVKFKSGDDSGDMPVGNVTLPNDISTNYDGKAEFPLGAPKYDYASNSNVTFVGWSNKVANALWMAVPAGTWADVNDVIELYAIWKAAKTLTIQTNAGKGETPSNSVIKVDKEWIEKNIGKTEDVTEIKTNLEKKVENKNSDLTYWQAYLLGIDPKDPNAELKVEKTNGDEDGKALVVSTVQVSAPDAGIKVGYSLDKVGSDEEAVQKPGAEQTTKDLKIDLEPEGDTPTGYYKMNVIFTPTEDGVEKEDEKVKIPADNTIGVLKVESDEKLVPIAVPWNSLDNGGEITAAEIVKTSTLSDSDMLHVYDANSEQKAYHNYKLENGEWKWVASYRLDANGVVTTTPAVEPEDDKIARGSSVWLERSSTEKPFYLIGQYKSEEPAKSVVKAPEVGQERPEYSLIAPTGIEDTDLNAVPDLQAAAAENKDDMIVVKRNGISVRYSPTEDGKWGYNKTVYRTSTASGRVIKSVQTVTDDAKVQAGLGIWYLSKGTEQMEIDWNAAKASED